MRYALWLKEVAQGNLGFSFMDRQPIAEKIGERIWPTLRLMLTAQLIAIVIAIPVGVLSAIKQYSFLDYLATMLGFAAISIPSFFLALAGIYVFALKLRWLPSAGMVTVGQEPSLARLALAPDPAGDGAGPGRGGAADPLHPLQHAGSDPAGLRAGRRGRRGCASGR